MIKTIEGADWEGYEYFFLELSEGTNTIVGKSHSGKSSLVRSLNWVLENRPQGISYFPHGKKKPETEVSVDFSDGNITRTRNNEDNNYTVSGTEGVLTALRSGVPDQVREVSNMTDVNIQIQKDVHFFLSDSWTGGKRAKKLNEVAKLEEMDYAMEIINSKVDSINADYKKKTYDLDIAEGKLQKLSWLDEAQILSDTIIGINEEIQKLDYGVKELKVLSGTIKTLQEELETLPDVSALPLVQGIIDLSKVIDDLALDIQVIAKTAEDHGDLILQLNDMILPDPKHIAKLDTITAEIQALTIDYTTILSIDQEYADLLKEKELADKEVESYETSFIYALKSNGVCPLCERSAI